MMRHAAVLGLVLVAAGCAGTSATPPAPAESASRPNAEGSPLGSPFGEPGASSVRTSLPLVIDRGDLRLGTTVQLDRIPTAAELHDLTLLPGLARLVLSFREWPLEYAPLEVLNQSPEGVELMVVLPGWPPSRAAVDAWNYLRLPTRIVVVVPGPPPTIDAVTSLNELRGLERVIAQMDDPRRVGFERLQRPLSFRKVIE